MGEDTQTLDEVVVTALGIKREQKALSYNVQQVKGEALTAVKDAGPNACPPMVVGVGLGGSFEKAAFLAKKALTRNLDTPSEKPHIAKLEKELLEEINQLGIGPGLEVLQLR